MDYSDKLEKFWNATRDDDERDYDALSWEEMQKVEKDYIAEKQAMEAYTNPYAYYGVER